MPLKTRKTRGVLANPSVLASSPHVALVSSPAKILVPMK